MRMDLWRLSFPFWGVLLVASCSVKERLSDEALMAHNQGEGGPALMEEVVEEKLDPAITLPSVYFAYDKAGIRRSQARALNRAARWLKRNPRVTVQIEGYCDERGSDDYNLQLGEKRARAAKRYLVRMGIHPDRITTISYGRVFSNGRRLAKNRRTDFMLIY